MASKIYQTKIWKEKRAQWIQGKVCEMCGSTEKLQIHHLHINRGIRKSLEKKVIRELIKHKMKNLEIPPTIKQIRFYLCECGNSSQKIRLPNQKTITCLKCKQRHYINRNNIQIRKVLDYWLGPDDYQKFIKTYRLEIKNLMDQQGAPEKEDYLDFSQGTAVLCRRCHYGIHHGLNLCPKCKKRLKRIQYPTCWDCKPEKKQQNYIQNHNY